MMVKVECKTLFGVASWRVLVFSPLTGTFKVVSEFSSEAAAEAEARSWGELE